MAAVTGGSITTIRPFAQCTVVSVPGHWDRAEKEFHNRRVASEEMGRNPKFTSLKGLGIEFLKDLDRAEVWGSLIGQEVREVMGQGKNCILVLSWFLGGGLQTGWCQPFHWNSESEKHLKQFLSKKIL